MCDKIFEMSQLDLLNDVKINCNKELILLKAPKSKKAHLERRELCSQILKD